VESCCSASCAHDTARTEAERLGLLACLAKSNFKRIVGGQCQAPPTALVRQCERLQIAGRQKGLAWKAVAQPHLPTALLAQRRREWGCLLVLPPQTSNIAWDWCVCLPGSFLSSVLKMRTSAESWQPEGAILESCCSASSAHGTARTEAERLGLLACLASSNDKRNLGGPSREPPAALLRKCERLQIAGSQKGLAWKAVSQPHLPMALLAQRHRDRGWLLVLPPQTSNISYVISAGRPRQSCSENANVCRQLEA